MKAIILAAITLSLGIIGFTSCNDELDSTPNTNVTKQFKALPQGDHITDMIVGIVEESVDDVHCRVSDTVNCIEFTVSAAYHEFMNEFIDACELGTSERDFFIEQNRTDLELTFNKEHLDEVINGVYSIEINNNQSSHYWFNFKLIETGETMFTYPFAR